MPKWAVVSVQFSTVQDGIHALGKAHMRSTRLSEVSPMLPLIRCSGPRGTLLQFLWFVARTPDTREISSASYSCTAVIVYVIAVFLIRVCAVDHWPADGETDLWLLAHAVGQWTSRRRDRSLVTGPCSCRWTCRRRDKSLVTGPCSCQWTCRRRDR